MSRFDKVFYVSAKTKYGINELESYLENEAQESLIWEHHP
jgi:hypothetical protein